MKEAACVILGHSVWNWKAQHAADFPSPAHVAYFRKAGLCYEYVGIRSSVGLC